MPAALPDVNNPSSACNGVRLSAARCGNYGTGAPSSRISRSLVDYMPQTHDVAPAPAQSRTDSIAAALPAE